MLDVRSSDTYSISSGFTLLPEATRTGALRRAGGLDRSVNPRPAEILPRGVLIGGPAAQAQIGLEHGRRCTIRVARGLSQRQVAGTHRPVLLRTPHAESGSRACERRPYWQNIPSAT